MKGWALLFTAITAGCGAFDDFEVTIEDSVSIPGTYRAGQVFNPAFLGGFNGLDLRADRTFTNNDVSPEDVDAIFVKSVVLEDSQGQLNNLQHVIESVELFVEAPGQARQKVAAGSGFPLGATAPLTVVPELNLKPFAVAPSMKLSAEVKLQQPPAFEFRLKTVVILLVDINLLGT